MKNSKNLKTALTAGSIIAIFVAMVMALIVSISESTYYFYGTYVRGEGEDIVAKLYINWDFAGLYLAMLVIGFGALLTKFVMFTIPTIKDRTENANISFICEILVLASLAFAIIGLFLPQTIDNCIGIEKEYEEPTFVASIISAWVACPLAFIGSLGTIGLNRLAK